MSRLASTCVCAVLAAMAAAPAAAGDAPAPGPRPRTIPVAATTPLIVETNWTFVPRPGRADVFYDRVKELEAQASSREDTATATVVSARRDILDELIAQLTSDEARIRDALAQRKFQDVRRDAQTSLAKIVPQHAQHAQIRQLAGLITAYATQAEDAIIRAEALEQFRKLAIRVEGVLWSDQGIRLALLSGEAQALPINKTVKGLATIISIDRDRVDFRFHHERSGRLFEFPVFIGENSADTQSASTRR